MAIAKQTTATVIPALQYQDAPAAIDFLCKAFGFEKRSAASRMPSSRSAMAC
jgi:uncharacterized glyoxalase superfamily protein PhnB